MVFSYLKKTIFFGILGVFGSYLYSRAKNNRMYLAQTKLVINKQKDDLLASFDPKVQEIFRKGINTNLSSERSFFMQKSLFVKAIDYTASQIKSKELIKNFDELYANYHVVLKKNVIGSEKPTLEISVKVPQEKTGLILIEEILNIYYSFKKNLIESLKKETISYLDNEIEKKEFEIKEIGSKHPNLKKEVLRNDHKVNVSQALQLRQLAEEDLKKVKGNLDKINHQIKNLLFKIRNETIKDKGINGQNNPIVQMIETQLNRNKNERQELLKDSQSTDDSDQRIKELEINLEVLKEKSRSVDEKKKTNLLNSIDLELRLQKAKLNQENLKIQLKILQEQYSNYEASLSSFPKKEFFQKKYNSSDSKIQVKRLNNQLELIKNFDIKNDFSSIEIKEDFVYPLTHPIIFWGGCTGVFFGIIAHAYFYRRFYKLEQIEQWTSLPILATCSFISKEQVLKALKTSYTENFFNLKCFQSLVQNFYSDQFEKGSTKVLFTHIKSSLASLYSAINIASICVAKNKKVLLVDINPQIDSLTHVASLEEKEGFCEWVFTGSFIADISKYTIKLKQANLEIIPYGKIALTYFTSIELEKIIHTLENYADVIILLAPSYDKGNLIPLLSKKVDHIYLTLSTLNDKVKNIINVGEFIKKYQINCDGIIITDVKN